MKRRELIAVGGAALVSTGAHAVERTIGWISPESREATARPSSPPSQAIVSAGDENILGNHRREIVALFCDRRGCTAYSETSEPEDIMQLLAEYHGALGPLIRTYEGTLDRFTGDGMMVFFNDPLPCPDAPEAASALRTASTTRRSAPSSIWRRACAPKPRTAKCW